MSTKPGTLTHEQVDAKLQAAIKAAIKAGARPEDLRILWNGVEWRWSAPLRRWDVYDPKLAKRVTAENDDG